MKKVVIAAVCSRPFVQAAAKAGYDVIAFDVFADADTQHAAQQLFKMSYANGGFDGEEFERVLSRLDLTDVVGFAYGSGFETQPDLLARISGYLPLLGNEAAVVGRLKSAPQFFELLDTLDILHPAVSFEPLLTTAGWIQKHAGGSGGTHVALAPLMIAPTEGYYFQRVVAGDPVSMLFVADAQQVKVIGFNKQLLSATPDMPYRYGGVAGQVDLPGSVKQQLMQAAQKITSAVGLRGLNSLDGIMRGNQIWMLEINPRLSATFDLYQSDALNLFDLHVHASTEVLVDLPQMPKLAKAQLVFYAPCDLEFNGKMDWPEWTADIPVPYSQVAAGNPVCTVLAQAKNAEEARLLAQIRVSELENLIKNAKRRK